MKVHEIIQEQLSPGNVVSAVSTITAGSNTTAAMAVLASVTKWAWGSHPKYLNEMLASKWASIPVGLSSMLSRFQIAGIIMTWFARTTDVGEQLKSNQIDQVTHDAVIRLLNEGIITTLAANAGFKAFIRWIAKLIVSKKADDITKLGFLRKLGGTAIIVGGNLISAGFLYWAETDAGRRTIASWMMQYIDPNYAGFWNKYVTPITGGEQVTPATPKDKDIASTVGLDQPRDSSNDPQISKERLPGQLPGGQKRGGPPNIATDTPVPPSIGHDFVGSKVSGFDRNAVSAFGNRKSQ